MNVLKPIYGWLGWGSCSGEVSPPPQQPPAAQQQTWSEYLWSWFSTPADKNAQPGAGQTEHEAKAGFEKARDASAQVEASHIDLAPEEIQPERVPETSVAVENAKEKVEERAEETGTANEQEQLESSERVASQSSSFQVVSSYKPKRLSHLALEKPSNSGKRTPSRSHLREVVPTFATEPTVPPRKFSGITASEDEGPANNKPRFRPPAGAIPLGGLKFDPKAVKLKKANFSATPKSKGVALPGFNPAAVKLKKAKQDQPARSEEPAQTDFRSVLKQRQ